MTDSPTPAPDHARLAALYEVTRVLGSSLNLDEALILAMDAAIRLTGAERGFLMLYEDASGEFAFRLARNAKGESLDEDLFEVSRSVVQEVAGSRSPVVTTNAQGDPRFANAESIVQFSLRSIMAVPLLVRGQITGVLYVDNKAKSGMFEEADLELLNSFAGQAAVAIENARLYTQTDQALAARVAELQTMQTVDRQLNAALDFDKVLGVTLEWAIKRTRAETGWIGLAGPEDVWVGVGHGKGASLPLDHPLVKPVIATGEVQNLGPRASGDQVHLVAPVLREGKVIALINVERAEPAFPPSAQEFIARLADHAAIAIENARLYDAVKRANDAKSKFVSIVSHELRLPMTSIRGYTDLLRQGMVGPITDQQMQFLNIIRANVERMTVLVSDLSDISRIETGRLKVQAETLAVADVVREMLASIKGQIEAKGQILNVSLPAGLPPVRADKSRLIQILSNLLSNAHKYSPAGATLNLTAEAHAPHVRVSLSDTGYGITPEDQNKLFSQFFRSDDPNIREQTGWGLGLHITKRLIELMGGQIIVTSEPGQGSTFTFTVPVA